jgi:hypothetical protein
VKDNVSGKRKNKDNEILDFSGFELVIYLNPDFYRNVSLILENVKVLTENEKNSNK